MAPVLVPHLADRPMILKRYPNGIEEDFFFQHTVNDAPAWMRTVDLSRSGRDDEKTSRYVLVDDPMGLLWLVNLGNIDLNPWQSTAPTPDEPAWVLFDLDPADGLPYDRVVEAALLVRDALEAARGCAATRAPRAPAACTSWCPSSPGATFDDGPPVRAGRQRGPGARAPRPGHRRARGEARAGRGCTSTTSRTAAAAASPASTRCGPARARRWPRPLRWDEVLPGPRPARRSRWARWRGGSSARATSPRGLLTDRQDRSRRRWPGWARQPAEARRAPSPAALLLRGRLRRRRARRPTRRPPPPPSGTGYFVGLAAAGIGASVDLLGDGPGLARGRPGPALARGRRRAAPSRRSASPRSSTRPRPASGTPGFVAVLESGRAVILVPAAEALRGAPRPRGPAARARLRAGAARAVPAGGRRPWPTSCCGARPPTRSRRSRMAAGPRAVDHARARDAR